MLIFAYFLSFAGSWRSLNQFSHLSSPLVNFYLSFPSSTTLKFSIWHWNKVNFLFSSTTLWIQIHTFCRWQKRDWSHHRTCWTLQVSPYLGTMCLMALIDEDVKERLHSHAICTSFQAGTNLITSSLGKYFSCSNVICWEIMG